MIEIQEVDIRDIKPFVSRARPLEPFRRMKESIREYGVKMPIQVRRIKDPKFKYERIVGEGRIMACRELKRYMIPAIIVNISEGEIVGRFLAENVLRNKLPWQDKAKLIKHELGNEPVNRERLEQIASRYHITPAHVSKLLKILQQASPKVSGMIDKLTVEEAETLTSLPASGQEIVVETVKEAGLPTSQLTALVAKAKEVSQDTGDLSKRALKQSLKRVDEDLARLRESLKLKRLHWSLGPSNLQLLLSDAQFKKAVDRRKISYQKFEEAV